jgi:hypothetical protein
MEKSVNEVTATPTASTLKWIGEESEKDEGVRALRDALNASGGTLMVQTTCYTHSDLPALKFTTTGRWVYLAKGFILSESKNSKCIQSPTGRHEWKTVESVKTNDGREDWSVIPGDYCLHCEGKKA